MHNMAFTEIPVLKNSSRGNYGQTTFNVIANRTAEQDSETSVHLTLFLSIIPWFLIILSASVLLSNGVVLCAFVKNRNLRTAFNMYLISLILADVAQALFDLPLTVLGMLVPVWPLGHIGCNFNLYGKWVFSAAVRNTHSLISLNRIWALFFPISYKHYHTKTLAIWLCVGSWVYVHVFLLPGLIPDALYFRVDDGSCLVNTTANRAWALPTQMVLYNSTLVVILFTYPVIWWKVRQRRKVMPSQTKILFRARSNGKTIAEDRYQTCINIETVSGLQGAPTGTTPAQIEESNSDEPEDDGHVTRPHVTVKQLKSNGRAQTPLKRSQSFAVLTYLVIGVVVCWMPIMVFFTLSILQDYDNFLYFLIGSLLYYFNSLLDPIFFTMAITPLRMTIYHLFTHRKNAVEPAAS